MPEFDADRPSTERRRSLFSRLRSRAQTSSPRCRHRRPRLCLRLTPVRRAAEGPRRAPPPVEAWQARPVRNVHAVPANDEHRVASAVVLFNRSDHRRTVAGVARSTRTPMVNVAAVEVRFSLVRSSSPGSCAGTATRLTSPTTERASGHRSATELKDPLAGARSQCRGRRVRSAVARQLTGWAGPRPPGGSELPSAHDLLRRSGGAQGRAL